MYMNIITVIVVVIIIIKQLIEPVRLGTSQQTPRLAIELERDTTESGVYPIVLVSYHLACQSYDDAATAANVVGFLEYVISEEGQQAAADAAGSAPISDESRAAAQAAINLIQTG